MKVPVRQIQRRLRTAVAQEPETGDG
jgi:hypothetical protein